MEININKSKAFSISLITEGIDASQMKFRFCIEINEMVYSFPVELNGDNLKVVLPPLTEKIKNIETGNYNAFLESYSLNEQDKGYYLRPWQDKIELKKEPRVSAQIKEENETSKIKAQIIENDSETSQKQDKVKDWPDPPPSYTMKETSDKKKKVTRFGKKLTGDK